MSSAGAENVRGRRGRRSDEPERFGQGGADANAVKPANTLFTSYATHCAPFRLTGDVAEFGFIFFKKPWWDIPALGVALLHGSVVWQRGMEV
jgi:hypothetical protein